MTALCAQNEEAAAAAIEPPRYEERRNWYGRTERWYTAEEVARHNRADDLWLVVHGRVYDASAWVVQHPGGAAALLRAGGGDASRDFDFHSTRARKLWEKLLIGRLDTRGACREGDWWLW